MVCTLNPPAVKTENPNEDENNTLPLSRDYGRTERANCQRLIQQHGRDLRYVQAWKSWLAWDGQRWKSCSSAGEPQQRAIAVADDLWREILSADGIADKKAVFEFARTSASARGITAMLALARSDSRISIDHEQLNRDGWLLNVENGTLDLRTATLRPHNRDDLLTTIAPVVYDPNAECPTWLKFLNTITAGDAQLQQYLRRAVGMSLAGAIREHVLLFCHGGGNNGKSTFLGAIQDMLGLDYGMKAPQDLLMQSHGQKHPCDLADLFQKRFVACIEPDEGKRLNESLVKEMTGGDRIRARRMRENFWEFPPTHKVWLAANHRPVIRGTDNGIWRRVKLIPFTVKIPDDQIDTALPEKLKAERAGILSWAILGCTQWQVEGLGNNATVTDATKQYRDESDEFGQFLTECCVHGPTCEVKASSLLGEYNAWADKAHVRNMNSRAMGESLTARGYDKKNSNGVRYLGIGLKAPQHAEQ